MFRSLEIDAPGFYLAKLNNGRRTPVMSDLGVDMGFVIDMRVHDTALWKLLTHGAVPLTLDATRYGEIQERQLETWRNELGDTTVVLLVPTIRPDRSIRYSWGPVKSDELERELPDIRRLAAAAIHGSIRERSHKLAFEVVTGMPFDTPDVNPVFFSGQFTYEK